MMSVVLLFLDIFWFYFRVTTVAQLSISRLGTGTGKAVTLFPWSTPACYWICARRAPRNWPSTHRTQITPGPMTTLLSLPFPAEFQVQKSINEIHTSTRNSGDSTRCCRHHASQPGWCSRDSEQCCVCIKNSALCWGQTVFYNINYVLNICSEWFIFIFLFVFRQNYYISLHFFDSEIKKKSL